ncbi:MAG: hypothetical protein FWF81_02910 [Defluviitaleaceae bacterium]|nr:hypothetical protein [Defluviitaleaceae bacterium]
MPPELTVELPEAPEEPTTINNAYLPPSTGRIFMFGEIHGVEEILERKLEIWGEFYREYEMRHFFIEAPFFTAYFLNEWMQAEDDTILYELFADWHYSSKNNPYQLDFYRTIKREFPETVFHGIDVGHGSSTTGQRLIEYLTANNLTDTEAYTLTRENMRQLEHFDRTRNHGLRSSVYMPQNFIREFDRLGDQSIMLVNGGAHTHLGYFEGQEGIPTLASVLYERYGNALQLFDLTGYAIPAIEPLRTDLITVSGIEFEASYFGIDDTAFSNVIGREFWRLENAYAYFHDSPLTGEALPFMNFPTRVEIGQVFIMDVHRVDGTVDRMYFRVSGYYWRNMPSAQEFIPSALD